MRRLGQFVGEYWRRSRGKRRWQGLARIAVRAAPVRKRRTCNCARRSVTEAKRNKRGDVHTEFAQTPMLAGQCGTVSSTIRRQLRLRIKKQDQGVLPGSCLLLAESRTHPAYLIAIAVIDSVSDIKELA